MATPKEIKQWDDDEPANQSKFIDSLPLVNEDNNGNMLVDTITDPNDLDINLNGMTLYPNVDYSLYIPTVDSPSLIPSLIVFRNTIPQDKIDNIEITRKNKGENHSFFWNSPAVGTTNIFSMDDDRLLFIEGTFSVYVNNYKISTDKVTILNTKSIKITGAGNLKNVMVRFSYPSHTNLQLILDYYKYQHMDQNDEYYHLNTSNAIADSFDDLTGYSINSLDSKKLILINKLLDKNREEINANVSLNEMWDTVIDGRPFNEKYLNQSYEFNMNESKTDNDSDVDDGNLSYNPQPWPDDETNKAYPKDPLI